VKPTIGEAAAERCQDCRQLRENGYRGASGWHLDENGQRHNHLTRVSSPVAAARVQSAPVLTAEEIEIAAQMGVPVEAMLQQKQLDSSSTRR
jgi:hypothetical protein